jgi:branched-chain amino acid transport system substrate-binding protein
VVKGGGQVKGTSFYPFPTTSDFSALLLQAQASGANVLALCNGGADTVSSIKQAHEFGLQNSMKIVSLLSFDTDLRAIGLEAGQGLMATTTYYWDLNDRTRAFNERIKPKVGKLWPNMSNAGLYSSTIHYLKAVADMGIPAAKADGAAVIARMKAIPTDDDAFGPGKVREDGRKIHPAYLMEVKKPSESNSPYDVLKLIATVPADQAWRPVSEGHCAMIKA